jgi:rod shape-determining protein MreD
MLLGQHALAYSLLAFAAITLSRRILWFGVWGQALHVALLLVFAEGVSNLIRIAAGASFAGWLTLAGPLTGALLWPLLGWVLLIPQRRPIDIDETRPL